jgi:hypothetical protein
MPATESIDARALLKVLGAVKKGDFSVRMPSDQSGVPGKIAPLVTAQHGAFYIHEVKPEDEPALRLLASYAFNYRKNVSNEFRLGESLVGQAALEKTRILLTHVPDDYMKIASASVTGRRTV